MSMCEEVGCLSSQARQKDKTKSPPTADVIDDGAPVRIDVRYV
jgi:hypothetical protein